MEEGYQITAYCLAYNHEKYIRKTLEGFVGQKTNFKFKVVVHDDASTDRTQEIIAEFARQYPEIIFPIYQKENQYSKKVKIYHQIIAPMIDTKYVAVCEGDDYWQDENKLQLQYDYMEAHPQCSLCVHNTAMINEAGEPLGRNVNTAQQDRDYTAEDVISATGGKLFHTSSFLYRKSMRDSMPAYFTIPGIGDYPLAMHLAMNGYVHYFTRIMSAYRVDSVGSWSIRSKAFKEKHYQNMLHALKSINENTDYRYDNAFQVAIAKYKYDLKYYKDQIFSILKEPDTRAVFRRYSVKDRGIIVAKCIIRGVLKKLHLWKR